VHLARSRPADTWQFACNHQWCRHSSGGDRYADDPCSASTARGCYAKGGITSAEVARTGLGARAGDVLGQVLAGVSVWSVAASPSHPLLYIVVPGNVGEADTLRRILAPTGLTALGRQAVLRALGPE
jgi:hypothetical protein